MQRVTVLGCFLQRLFARNHQLAVIAGFSVLGLASVGLATPSVDHAQPQRSSTADDAAREGDEDGGDWGNEQIDPSEAPEIEAQAKGMKDFARANASRWRWMNDGVAKLKKLRDSSPATVDVDVQNAVKSWLHLTPDEPDGDRDPTRAELDALIAKFEANRNKTGVSVTVAPRVAPFSGCPAGAWACTVMPSRDMIHLFQEWVDASTMCQDTVLVHEYFHATGHDHLSNERKCKDGVSITAAEALSAPDCLAGLACELDAGGSGCGKPC